MSVNRNSEALDAVCEALHNLPPSNRTHASPQFLLVTAEPEA